MDRCKFARTLLSAVGLVAVGVWTGFMMHVTQPEHAVKERADGVVLPPVRAVREEEDLDSAASVLSLHEEQEDPLAITREDWSAGGRFSRSEPRPLSSNYPETEPLVDIISRWNPDNVTVPTPFKEKLAVFNFSNATERALAETYRDAELPFKVFDVPNVEEVRQKWTDPYLIEMMEAGTVQYKVEQSSNNHFMYWQHKAGVLSLYSDWKPPTNIVSHVTFSNWLNMARAADAEAKGPEEEHYYLMLGTAPLAAIRKRVGRIVKPYQHFVTSDLPIFVPDAENFFVTDAEANKGIQCRFGMRGVIAEAHYDGGRNMVAMLKGAKRYILAPPTACQRLSIIPDRRHPSFRHSTADWSDAREAGDRLSHHEAAAIDTVVREGEILYIPSFWIHYIISLKYSIQCNTRSGAPPNGEGRDAVNKCVGEENMNTGRESYFAKKKKKRLRKAADAY